MTRLLLFLSVSLPLLVVVGLLGRYGTMHPCSILSHTLRMQLTRATRAMPETGTKEELDAKHATQPFSLDFGRATNVGGARSAVRSHSCLILRPQGGVAKGG